MKHLTVLIFVFMGIISNAQNDIITKEEFKEIRKSLPSGVEYRYDPMDGKIWVNQKKVLAGNGGSYQSSLECYYQIFKLEGKLHLGKPRIVIKYVSSNWMFMDEIMFMDGKLKDLNNGIGDKLIIEFDKNDVDRKAHGGSISETIDKILSSSEIEYFESIIKKDNLCRIKFSGEGKYSIHVFMSKEKEPIKIFFDNYNAAKEKIK